MDLVKTDSIEKEIKGIISYPQEQFIKIIQEVGFKCDLCGKCCTSEFNDHVFLLDDDTQRIIEHSGRNCLRPAPYYDLCDNLGRFYVSGYALKIKPGGNCIFYTGGRCEIYNIRPLICRIYPYMLHREADDDSNVEWRQISGLNRHGFYYNDIDAGTCKEIIMEVKNYESGFLKQKIRFLHAIGDLFREHGLRQSQQMYDRQMRNIGKGKEIEVYVFLKGSFVKEIISNQIINPK